MKRPQVVLAVTAFNFIILGLAALAINAAAQAPELPQSEITPVRVNWQNATSSDLLPTWQDVSLTPTKRSEIQNTTTTTTEVVKEPTDAELRAELEAKFAREVKLLRIMYAEGQPELCFAKVRVGSREIVLAPNASFYAAVAQTLVKNLPAWLADVQVKSISAEGVTLNAASSKIEKRFDLILTMKETGLITVGPHRDAEPKHESVLPRQINPVPK